MKFTMTTPTDTPETDALIAEWWSRANQLPGDLTLAQMKLELVEFAKEVGAHARSLELRLTAAKADYAAATEQNRRLCDRLNHAVTELARAALSEDFDGENCMDAVKLIEDEFAVMGKTTDWHMINSWYDNLCEWCGVDNGDEIDVMPIVKERLASIAAATSRAERAEKDAARYRWLRDIGDSTWAPMSKRPGVRDCKQIDKAIDAALSGEAHG